MRFHALLGHAEVLDDVRDLGLDSIREVLLYRTPEELYHHLRRRGGRAHEEDGALRERCRRVYYLASKVACAARDVVSLGDPVARALRHHEAPDSRLGGSQSPVLYVKPSSIQSTLSPAAYLKDIHDLARTHIQSHPGFGLGERRPDLEALVLSEDNLGQEISTLSLVNEILAALLTKKGLFTDAAPMRDRLVSTVHPFAMPLEIDHATTREALAAMGLDLNTILLRGWDVAFPLLNPQFNLVAEQEECLRLYGTHMRLLRMNPSDQILYQDWYGGTSGSDLRHADAFCAATGLTFEELRAFVGDDCDVVDAFGGTSHQTFGFLHRGLPVRLRREAGGRHVLEGQSGPAWGDLSSAVHATQNKCLRLQRRTGLAFHELDRLLTATLRSVAGATYENIWVVYTPLNVLAHFVEYRKRLHLDVDQFVALIDQINSVHRVGSAEPSLLRRLFGAQAASVQRALDARSVTMGDLDPSRGLTELGEVLRGGLGVTSVEWLAIVGEVAPDPATVLEPVVLARLYRVATVLRSLGLGVLEGLALAKTIDVELVRTLARKSDCNDVLSAIDRLVWLSDWMKESAFSPLQLLAILSVPDASQMFPSQDTLNWVVELQQAIQSTLVTTDSLRPYTLWNTASGDTISINELALFATISLYFSNGLVQHNYTSMLGGILQISTLSMALTAFLATCGVDLSIAQNQERFDELFAFLVEREDEQAKVLAAQVVKHADTLSDAAVTPILGWMGTTPFEALKTFMAWDTKDKPANVSGMTLLLNLRRHLLVVSHLRMDEPEIELVDDHPEWLGDKMKKPLSMRQVHLLWCLKKLQNAEVSANDWIAYFTLVRSKTPKDAGKMLARLLDWPESELVILGNSPGLGVVNGLVTTVEQADILARRIALCRDGSLGAKELTTLFDASIEAGDRAGDWAAAARSAMAGLRRKEGGAYVAAAQGNIDEELRDALVALTLTQVMAKDPALKERVTDAERLYEYLLLDVNVSAAVPTTRLLEATGSVQLYINQVLENVEQAQIVRRDELRAVWEVAQQYRVWEANESLKLYPSNYIEPELRREKSELFRQLEQAITQGDLNEDLVRTALTGYVSGLQRLTELRPHGFFYTRNAAPMTYYFTARAQHEQYGYYIRRLDADMDRLSGGDALHALSWGDWQKASVPISAQYAYGVVPAFAWNRLFLLWFELEKVTRVDADGKPVDSYHLRPKYSRQNLDGTFTEAQSLTQPGFDLDVTADLPLKKVDASRASAGEEPAPELYDGPVLYQPCYMPGTDSLLLWFKLPGRSASVPARAYSWSVRPNASTIQLETTIDASVAPHTLEDYTSVSHALQLVRDESIWLQPASHVVPAYFEYSQGSAYMQIGSRFDSTLKATLEPGQEGTVQVTVPGQGIWIQGKSGSVSTGMFGLSSIPVSYRLDAVRFEARAPSGETQSVELYKGPIEFGEPTRIPLTERTLQVKLPAGVDHGKISMQLVFECYEVGIGGPTPFRQPFETDFSSQDRYISHLYFGKDEAARPGEYYLLTEVAKRGALVFALGSNAMREVAVEAGSLFDMFSLLRRENQRRPESGVGELLHQAAGRYTTILAPEPRSVLDFNGPFGLYAWELFYHIPSLIAATYRKIGKFEVAREWLGAIYDPSAERDEVWRCEPLVGAKARSLSIADPDRLATENPGHYCLATIRQYLRTMTEQGDAYYRQETAETLRQARMWYVSALRLFTEEMGDSLDQATRSEWTNPTLGSTNIDFRPPYNEDLRSDYTTIAGRLDNLRNWRSFDGEPLQIALLAPKLNPRELQLAALSGLSATAAGGKSAQMRLPFTFQEALSKAKEAVRNLMYFGDLLTKGLHRQDEQSLAEMQSRLAHHVAANFERDGQASLIESMKLEVGILEKSKDEAEKSLEWYEKLAGERFNASEIAAFPLWGTRTASLFAANFWCGMEEVADMMPNIYGLAVGGQKYGGIAEYWKDVFEKGADIAGTVADTQVFNGEAVRRQQENTMQRDVGKIAVERIAKEIARLEYDLGEEEGTLVVLEEKARRTEGIVDFHARRATNKDFHNWYVGRMTSLYNAAYDMALRFCRMAERAYQVEDSKARFINPVWDAQYKGLLSGQGLMLDLQRMDYAYMHRQSATDQRKLRVSLSTLDARALLALRTTGQAMFSLGEDLFDEQFPDEYERRIKSVRLRLIGVEARDDIAARLALIGDRVHRDRRRSPEESETHVLGRQQLTLSAAETDTSRLPVPEGRLLPFERCGVESTWLLSIPGAVRAIEAKQKTFRQQELLEQLTDVTLEITYTARV